MRPRKCDTFPGTSVDYLFLNKYVPSAGAGKKVLGGKTRNIWTKFFWVLVHHTHKKYISRKIEPKSPISALGSGRSNLQPLIWACHCQLDDQYRYPKDNTEII